MSEAEAEKAPEADAGQLLDKDFLAHVQALIRGDKEPSSKMSRQLVDQLKEAYALQQTVIRNLQTGERQLAQLRDDSQKYEGAITAYVQALRFAENQ